jgi:hypothetical protein
MYKGLRRMVRVGPLHYVIKAHMLRGYKDRNFGFTICVEPFLNRHYDGGVMPISSHMNYSNEEDARYYAGDMLDFIETLYRDLVDRNLGL